MKKRKRRGEEEGIKAQKIEDLSNESLFTETETLIIKNDTGKVLIIKQLIFFGKKIKVTVGCCRNINKNVDRFVLVLQSD